MKLYKPIHPNIELLLELSKDEEKVKAYQLERIKWTQEMAIKTILKLKQSYLTVAEQINCSQLSRLIKKLANSISRPRFNDEWLKTNFETAADSVDTEYYQSKSVHKTYLAFMLQKFYLQYLEKTRKSIELLTDTKEADVKNELFWIRKHFKRFVKFNKVILVVVEEICQLGIL